MWKKLFIGMGLILLGACGGGASVNVSEVLGIPPGDKEGTALSGVFTTIFEATSEGCTNIPGINVPPKGTPQSLTVTVTQNEGAITFDQIEGILRGGISFDNKFEAGAADVVSQQNEDNILRSVLLKGSFEDANSFKGNGNERLLGRIQGQEVDCTFSFKVEGIRQ